jgi:hypothetical protein
MIDHVSYEVAQWGRLFVVRWHTPEAAEVHRVVDQVASLHARHGRLFFVSAASPRTGLVDEPTRRAFLDNAERLFEHCDEVHLVIDAPAFIAAIVRSVVAASGLTRRYGSRLAVHATIEEAIERLRDRGQIDVVTRVAASARFGRS